MSQVEHKGIINCGNSCFMNATMQMFIDMPEFIKSIIYDTTINNPYDNTSVQYKAFNDGLTIKNSLSVFFKAYNTNSSKKDINIENLWEVLFTKYNYINLSDKARVDYDKNDSKPQCDSAELLEIFANINDYNTNIGNQVLFKVNATKECMIDNNKSAFKEITNTGNTTESYFYLQLQIPQNTELIQTISELITNYITVETATDDNAIAYCATKANSQNPTLTTTLKINIPTELKYFIIQLKRFHYNAETGSLTKIDKPVAIEHIIKIDNVSFKLKGTIMHRGSLTGGHYVYWSFSQDNKLIVCNDNEIYKPTDIVYNTNIVDTDDRQLFNHSYILLYERIDTNADQVDQTNNSSTNISATPTTDITDKDLQNAIAASIITYNKESETRQKELDQYKKVNIVSSSVSPSDSSNNLLTFIDPNIPSELTNFNNFSDLMDILKQRNYIFLDMCINTDDEYNTCISRFLHPLTGEYHYGYTLLIYTNVGNWVSAKADYKNEVITYTISDSDESYTFDRNIDPHNLTPYDTFINKITELTITSGGGNNQLGGGEKPGIFIFQYELPQGFKVNDYLYYLKSYITTETGYNTQNKQIFDIKKYIANRIKPSDILTPYDNEILKIICDKQLWKYTHLPVSVGGNSNLLTNLTDSNGLSNGLSNSLSNGPNKLRKNRSMKKQKRTRGKRNTQ